MWQFSRLDYLLWCTPSRHDSRKWFWLVKTYTYACYAMRKWKTAMKTLVSGFSLAGASFSYPASRKSLLLRLHDLWPDSIFWACAEYSIRILSHICRIWREDGEKRTSGVGPAQKARFLMLTETSTSSGDENGQWACQWGIVSWSLGPISMKPWMMLSFSKSLKMYGWIDIRLFPAKECYTIGL